MTFCPFRYQGQYHDTETGLYYNRFRYYSPEEGRYISQDPIGLAGGMALYGYVHDVNGWVDVLGLISRSTYSGRRGVIKAKSDLQKNGFTIVSEEVTIIVGGKRIRADIVAKDANGNVHIFEVKNGSGRLTKNQSGSGVFGKGPANTNSDLGGGGILPSKGTSSTFDLSTQNPVKAAELTSNGIVTNSQPATFSLLTY